MRIEYDVTYEEFADAWRAVGIERRPLRRPASPAVATAIVAALIAMPVAMLAVALRAAHARLSPPPRTYFEWVAQLEWLLPWLAMVASLLIAAIGRRRPRVAAASVVATLAWALGSWVLMQDAVGPAAPLHPFGGLRTVPWLALILCTAALVARAIIDRAPRAAYDASEWAGGRCAVTADDRRLRDERVGMTIERAWPRVGWTHRTERVVVIREPNGGLAAIVPTRAIGTPADVDAFVDAIQRRLSPPT